MAKYTDSLRGYAYGIHLRDNFKCQYCGADGQASFEVWLTLSVDHLLPKGHPSREGDEYKVTACQFCNTADNRYFDKLTKLGLTLENLSRAELIAQRLEYVNKTRNAYKEFWMSQVATISPWID